jgi:arabinan endo-1,5-alpha-L-arabinosidase
MAGHGQNRGSGYDTVFTDNDADVLVYHYYDATSGDARIGINLFRYDNGWPIVYHISCPIYWLFVVILV